MDLGDKVNKFDLGDNDISDEGDGVGSVSCSICLDTVAKDGDRAWANLQCGHLFHLDCIGSAFNAKGVMQCPNCRKVEKGEWLYPDGGRSHPEFNAEDWVHEETIYELGGGYTEVSYGVRWCPRGSSARLPSFDDGEFSQSSYHNLLGQPGYFTEPAAPTAGHPCPYVTYFAPVHSSSSSTGGAVGVSESSSFNWNTGSSVSSEVQTPYGFPVDPHYHDWNFHSPPPPPPQHFSASVPYVGSATQPTPPPAAARTSRANGSDVIRPRQPHFMRPTYHGHSSSGRAGSSVASVPRTPPFPGCNTRTRDRTQALQAYYQQPTAQQRQPDSPVVSRGPRVVASGMGSTSSSSDQAGGSGFLRFNIWEREPPYMPSQQSYLVNQMDREPSIWTSSFNEGSGSFHQRHSGGGSS